MDIDSIQNDILNYSPKIDVLKYGSNIEGIINKYFPSIERSEKDFLRKCYYYLLDYIYQCLFKNESEFWDQMKSNDKRDMETIFLLLLPFLKNSNTKSLKSLNNLYYHKTKINIKELEKDVLQRFSDKLKYTNSIINLLNDNRLDSEKNKNDYFILDYRKMLITHLELTLLTVRRIKNKLMINWNGVWPMKINNFKINDNTYQLPNLDLVKDTVENLNNINGDYNQALTNPKGLWIGDIYDCIVHRFYKSLLPCKFLLYNYNDNGNILYGIFTVDGILSNLTNIKKVNLNKKYYEYSELEQEKIKNNYNNLLKDIFEREQDFIKNIVLIIDKYISSSVSLKNVPNDKENFDIIGSQDIEIDDVEQTDKHIEVDIFFNYLIDSIQKLKLTPYHNYFLKDIDNETYLKEGKDLNNGNFFNNELTPKMIYNWAKSLTSKNESFKLNSHYFISNPENNKRNLERLLSNRTDWFNLDLRKYGFNSITANDIHEIMIETHSYGDINIPFYLVLIFDDMMRTGVLSDFKVNTRLTDKKNEGYRIKELKKQFEENKEWEDSHYYWTNKPYKELKKYRMTDKDKPKDFFKLIYTNKFMHWGKEFANDWVAQIDFYTHFFNQQVMYLTGATGVGKSVHMPKITSYCVKTFMYNHNGYIVGTQPRISPLLNNTKFLSSQLGIPREDYDNIPGKSGLYLLPTDNYFIEYKYQKGNHMMNNSCLKMKMMTDGSLLSEIKNSLILKRKLQGKDKKITHTNTYDVFMIDEAHEHNTNMDLILSLLKNSLYYNPEVRLMIVSATMDDDEPIYRTYYSLLNDNHTYPYRSNSLYFPNNFIDANYYDRRYHISPPGKTTQHNIEEIYRPIQLFENMKQNAKLTQEASYNTVIEIATKNPNGEILLFSTGQREIIQAVEELNKKLPQKTIALPFYTKMNQKYKNIITSIEKHIKKLKVRKENVAKDWGNNYIEDKSVPDNLYDRAVIIATNVAEASITIARLKFVVDNGYAKVKGYDPIKGDTLEVEEISESSRLQRKGRVGRTSTGTVYYIYEKDKRKYNRPKLGITQDNPISWMSPLLSEKEQKHRTQNIMSEEKDFRRTKDFEILEKEQLGFISRSCELDILKRRDYLYSKNVFAPNSYYNVKDDEFSTEMLLDYKGKYWVIHPREMQIDRNIFYEIIKYEGKEYDEIPKYYQESVDEYLTTSKNYVIKGEKGNERIQTLPLMNFVSELVSSLELLESALEKAYGIFFGMCFNVLPELLLSISILETINNDLSKLYDKKELERLRKSCKYNSDLDLIIKISQSILAGCKDNIVKDYDRYNGYLVKNLINEGERLKRVFLTNRSKLEVDDIEILTKMKKSGNFNSEKEMGKLIRRSKYIKKYLSKNGLSINVNIENLRLLNKNERKVIEEKFVDYITKMLFMNVEKEMNDYSKLNDKDILKSMKKDVLGFRNLCKNKQEEILFCLIAGYEKNVVVNMSNKNRFYDYILPDLMRDKNNRFFVSKTIGYKRIPLTVAPKGVLQHYYANQNINDINYASMFSNLPIEWILVLDPKYMMNEFNDITVIKKVIIENKKVYNKKTIVKIPEIEYLVSKVQGKIGLLNYYWNKEQLRDVYVDIMEYSKNRKQKKVL